MSSVPDWLRSRYRLRSHLALCCLSEFFGTFVMMFSGFCFGAQYLLSNGTLGSYLQMSFAWGFIVTLVVYFTFHTSGAHLNPAISFTLFTMGTLKLRQFILYTLTQTIASFLAAIVSYHLVSDKFHHFAGGIKEITGKNGTAFLFANFADESVSNYTAFFDGFVATAMLCFIINGICDPKNKVPNYMVPQLIGLVIFVLLSGFGLNTGLTINPAGSFAGRLFLYLMGYGADVFMWHNYFVLATLISPFIGGPFGALLYHLSIGIHIPDASETLSEKCLIIDGDGGSTISSIDIKS